MNLEYIVTLTKISRVQLVILGNIENEETKKKKTEIHKQSKPISKKIYSEEY